MCRIIDECVAFNSNGDFKVFLQPESEWQKSSSTLYVADIDVCKAGFHNCFGSSTCTSEGDTIIIHVYNRVTCYSLHYVFILKSSLGHVSI